MFPSYRYVNQILELIFIALKEDGANIFSFNADKSTKMPAVHDFSPHCKEDVDASSKLIVLALNDDGANLFSFGADKFNN